MTLNAISNSAYIALQAFQGPADSTHITAIDYVSNPTLTSAVVASYPANVPANTSVNSPVSVSLLAIFPNLTSPVFLAVYDNTSPGQLFFAGLSSGSGMIEISAGGFMAFACGGTLPTTIYLANPSATIISDINIVVMSN